MKARFYITLTCLQFILSALHAGNGNAIVPADGNCCAADCCPGKVSIGAEWLYWKTEQDRMEIGAEVTTTPGVGSFDITSNIIRPHFKTESGYRVHADYTTPEDGWKLTASYTHAPTKAQVSLSENPMNLSMSFIALFNQNFPIITAITGATFDSVSADWHSFVDYLDIDIAKEVCVNDCLTINPHIGLRGFLSRQRFNLDGTATVAALDFTAHLKQKMSGIGVEGGLWGSYLLGNKFSVIGHIGGGLIYNKFHDEGTLNGSVDGTSTSISYTDSTHRSTAMVDTFIGVKYETCISELAVNVTVGWEQHYIFDTNQFSLEGGGNMTLQGLTLGGGITF